VEEKPTELLLGRASTRDFCEPLYQSLDLLRSVSNGNEHSKHRSILPHAASRNRVDEDTALEQRILHGARFEQALKPNADYRHPPTAEHAPPLRTKRSLYHPTAARSALTLRDGHLYEVEKLLSTTNNTRVWGWIGSKVARPLENQLPEFI